LGGESTGQGRTGGVSLRGKKMVSLIGGAISARKEFTSWKGMQPVGQDLRSKKKKKAPKNEGKKVSRLLTLFKEGNVERAKRDISTAGGGRGNHDEVLRKGAG